MRKIFSRNIMRAGTFSPYLLFIFFFFSFLCISFSYAFPIFCQLFTSPHIYSIQLLSFSSSLPSRSNHLLSFSSSLLSRSNQLLFFSSSSPFYSNHLLSFIYSLLFPWPFSGGRGVIDGIEKNLNLTPRHVEASRHTLYTYGKYAF